MQKLLILILFAFQVPALGSYTDFDHVQQGVTSQLPGIISEAEVDQIICGQQNQIKDHMAQMGFIIRGLRQLVNDFVQGNDIEELKATVMVDSQILRTHLTAVLPKTPDKIKQINPAKLQDNKIIFQRYILKMIGYTIDIEEELLKTPVTPDEIAAQRLKIANLIIAIDDTVQEAHNLFRF
jgi:hypothetical protein